MKNKLQYIIIFVLIISNVFLAYKLVNKKNHPKDNEFKREISYLKNRLGFYKNQLLEAKKEYKRYNKEKIYIKYERPILITTVIALLIINGLFIFNNINDTNNAVQYTLEEIYFESDKSDLINLASYEE